MKVYLIADQLEASGSYMAVRYFAGIMVPGVGFVQYNISADIDSSDSSADIKKKVQDATLAYFNSNPAVFNVSKQDLIFI